MLAALKQSRGRNNPLQRCHKDDNGNGHSGSLAKGTALHNGSKWIFALAPWAILFLRPGSAFLTLCDSQCLGFGATWALPSSHRAPSCPPSSSPTFPTCPPPCPSPPHTHTHSDHSAHRMKSVSRSSTLSGVFSQREWRTDPDTSPAPHPAYQPCPKALPEQGCPLFLANRKIVSENRNCAHVLAVKVLNINSKILAKLWNIEKEL